MKKILLLSIAAVLFMGSCKKDDEVTKEETTKEEQVTYENFFKVDEDTYIPDIKSFNQASIFGYDEAYIKYTIDKDAFKDYGVVIHISDQFDYRTPGTTFELTTVTGSEDVPKNKAYVKFTDRSAGFNKDVSYVATANQTIKMTVVENIATGIEAYFEFTDIVLDGGKKLTVKTKL